jgi:two-component system phosphate regulon sensor histidine kinase PhoR
MALNHTISELQDVHELWEKLTHELADIFDAHGICATVAYKIALHTSTTTVVGMRAPQQDYYDVWVCDSLGEMEQIRWRSEKAMFDSIVEPGRVVRLEKFGRPASEVINSELWQLPHEAILVSPLPYPGTLNPMSLTPPGMICLVDPDEHCCITLQNFEPLVTNISCFLDRAYLRHQVDRQEVEFAVVSDISYALTSDLSLENVFNQLRDPIRRIINVENVSMGLIDQTTNEIVFVDELMGPMFKDLPTIRLRPGQGIAGWVAENRQPVIVNNVYTDKRFFSQVDHQSGFETRSMICIPLQVQDYIIGVLQAINKQNGDFHENDLRLLQAMGGPLAAAIENANLHADVIAEKRRIETIFTSMSEGLLTVNAEGLITHANDSLLSLLQKELAEVVGGKADEVLRLKKGHFADFMAKVLTAENEDDYPQLAADVYRDVGSHLPVLISGAPIKAEAGYVSEMIFVFSDLRQIREVERIRDDFFHGIVHELRTPLATILMYARLIRTGKATDEEKADRFLGVIERESDRLQKMVRQMLGLAKIEAREQQRSYELIALNPLFEEILPQMADRATQKGLVFRQKIAADLPRVWGNQETIDLIFRNLVTNAIKFTLSGMVRFDAWAEDGSIFVKVQDEGIGIPEEAMPNMFQRFYRTKTAVERGIAGTGLGLYMVKESVENYSGEIKVESEIGKGTTFMVRLPVAEK